MASSGAGAFLPAIYSALGGGVNGMNFKAPQLSASGIGNDTQALMSPYTGSVINSTNAELDRQKQFELNNNAAAAGRAHAFGSDNAALMDTETNRNFDQIKAATDAGLYNNAYGNAQNTALGINSANLNSILQGAGINLSGTGLLGSLAGMGTNINNAGIQGLLGAGGVAQNTGTQQGLFNYGQYQQAYQSLYQRLAAQMQAAQSAPHDTSTTGTSTSQVYSSPLAQILGIGLGIAGLGGTGGMSSLLGGLGGLLGGGPAPAAATSMSQLGPYAQGPVYNP